jgi:serine/threonine-protein kinase HipA
MIKVWTDAAEAGLLDRHGERGSTFAYLPDTSAARAVSITMPVRLPSWSVPSGCLRFSR